MQRTQQAKPCVVGCNTLVERSESNYQILLMWAKACEQQGDYRLGKEKYTSVLNLDPYNAMAKNALDHLR
jgi:hypothetical protein